MQKEKAMKHQKSCIIAFLCSIFTAIRYYLFQNYP